jgi:hypothetical protein
MLIHALNTGRKAAFFPSSIRSQVKYSLYYPSSLPKDFKPVDGSIYLSEGVTTFNIEGSPDYRLAVSEQARIKGFDYDKFYRLSIDHSRLEPYTDGKLAVGQLNGYPICSLVTDSTWIIITSVDKNISDMAKFCQAMKPIS